MIRNLNQLNFQGFGTVVPTRTRNDSKIPPDILRQSLRLERQAHSLIYKTTSDSWVVNCASMTVLSVSQDGENFSNFYLDKPVCVKPGIYFTLTPMQQESCATLYSRKPPEETGIFHPAEIFHVNRKIQVSNIYTFFYQEREKGFLFPGESHSMIEFTYVDQGSIHSVADGQDLVLEQGDSAIYASNQWHMQYSDMDVSASFVTITFDVEGLDIAPLINRKFKTPQNAVLALKQMLHEQELGSAYSGDMMICQLTYILLTLLRDLDEPVAKLRTGNAIHSENQIIRRAQQYINSHIREKLSVPIVARHADVSPSYLTALFHKNLQISPGEYIRRAKLQESKLMIREGNLNFTEIAAALQYSTVHHFSRQFKEKFGITPTEYAKSIR